ncbi:hypothetical protein BKA70DRAFT_653098 [Coprinopsis sp. MPI-PUGE-AT-0042]|nr:hypothetical protein BKA70DRAFT_653098 [Coprinopsis sp. MPI-PUGE-AT-0042]
MGSSKHCVVIRGRRPGVYPNWTTAEPQVRNLGRVAIYESFHSKHEADEVYAAAEAKGFVQALDSESFDAGSVTFPLRASWDPIDGPWGHEVVSAKWHVVTCGLVPGIYPTWIDAGPQVKGVRGSVNSTAFTRQEAESAYLEVANKGQIRVLARRSPPSTSATYVSQAPIQPSHTASGNGNGHTTNVTRDAVRSPSKGLARESSLLFSNEPVEDACEAFRRVKISNDVHPSPDQLYRAPDDRRVKVERVDSSRRAQPLAQSHSWPTIRPASPDRRKPATVIARSHSDNLDQARIVYGSASYPLRRREERESGSKTSSSPSSRRSKTSGIIVGNPGHLKPFTSNVPSRTPASAPPGGMRSPNRVAGSPSISASRPGSTSASSRRIAFPEEQASTRGTLDTPQPRSPPQRHETETDVSESPRHSRRSPKTTTATKSDVTTSPINSPRTRTTPSGSSFTASPPSQRCRDSCTDSYGRSSNPPSSFSIGDIGFSPAHAPYFACSSSSDIRSPISNGSSIPLGRNSAAFGRPSPHQPPSHL